MSKQAFKSHWHHRSVNAALILFLVALGANAQQLPETRTQAASAKVEAKTGAISGRVVNESGQPLVNVKVWARPATRDGLPVTETITNRDGAFTVSGLERGSYSVNASMPSYIAKSEADPAVYKVGDSVTLVLIKGGVVTGTVTNSKGDPVVRIGVRVELVRDESGRVVGGGRYFNSVTDDRGIYRVYGIPSGTYVVAADGGVGYTPNGVNAFANDLPTYAPSSNRDAADEVSVRAGEETSNVDIRYRGERGSTISGIVSGIPKENRGIWVTLTSIADETRRWNLPFRDAGEFAFEGIPDGDYHLAAMAYFNERERGGSEALVLNVRGADIEGINLTPTPLASISGRVVLQALATPPPECTDKRHPLVSEASISAYQRVIQGSKKKSQFVWRVRGTRANAQGNLVLQDIPASEYYFGVRFSPQQWYLQSIAFATPNAKPIEASRTWTIVKPGEQLSGLTVTLAQGAALVRGVIPLADGEKLSEKLTVYLVPAETAKGEEPLLYFAAPVNSEGRFWLNNVAPGRYWMVAQPGTDDTRHPENKVRLPDSAELRSRLRHGAEQSKTEIELKPCQDVNFRLPL